MTGFTIVILSIQEKISWKVDRLFETNQTTPKRASENQLKANPGNMSFFMSSCLAYNYLSNFNEKAGSVLCLLLQFTSQVFVDNQDLHASAVSFYVSVYLSQVALQKVLATPHLM